MSTFRALQTSQTDEGYFSEMVERRVEELPEGDVLVRVEYSSLNYKDALSATGNKGVTRQYPHTPGIDAAGEVVEASAGPFRAGDKVIVTGYDLGMNTAGGYGEYIRVPAEWVVDMPEGLDTRTAMLYGTAGLTAALSIESLMDVGIQPGQSPLLVTGASGGVGSVAVAILAHLGVNVAAGTGSAEAADWLRELGAGEIVSREELEAGRQKPLLKPRWAAALDTVGGDILFNCLKSVHYGASVTCCGMAASPELRGTVFPFILRNVNLLGVDSVELPVEFKQQMWQLLAREWRPEKLDQLLAAEIGPAELPEWFGKILKGQVRGRVLVRHG